MSFTQNYRAKSANYEHHINKLSHLDCHINGSVLREVFGGVNSTNKNVCQMSFITRTIFFCNVNTQCNYCVYIVLVTGLLQACYKVNYKVVTT